MDYNVVKWAYAQKDLDHNEKFLLVTLACHWNHDKGCFPGIDKLCADTNLGRSTIFRLLNELEKCRKIQREKLPGKATKFIFIFDDNKTDTQSQRGTRPTEGPVPQRDPSHKGTRPDPGVNPSRSGTGPVPPRDSPHNINIIFNNIFNTLHAHVHDARAREEKQNKFLSKLNEIAESRYFTDARIQEEFENYLDKIQLYNEKNKGIKLATEISARGFLKWLTHENCKPGNKPKLSDAPKIALTECEKLQLEISKREAYLRSLPSNWDRYQIRKIEAQINDLKQKLTELKCHEVG